MEPYGLVDLTDLRPKDYGLFFLTRNPFPAIGVPGDTIPYTVDREASKKRFKDVVTVLQNPQENTSNTSTITVLVGDYGSGKSHLLKLFKQSVNTLLLPQRPGTIAIYIKSPGEDFLDFYQKFIEDIGRSFLESYSNQIIRKYFEDKPQKVASFIHDSDIKKQFLQGKYSIESVIQKSQRNNLFQEIRNDYFGSVGSSDLVFAFLNLSAPEYSSKAWLWFHGGKVDKEKEVLKIESSISDQEIAFLIFKDMFKLLKAIEIPSCVLLIDELERITLIHPTKKARYQDLLRELIDEFPNGLCLYFAIAPLQWQELTKEATALVRRLAGNWYKLDTFDKDLTKQLIETYLNSARVKNYHSQMLKEKYRECEPSLCPFTNSSIDSIQTISKGSISTVLTMCRDLLDELWDKRETTSVISAEFVEKMYKREVKK